MKMGFYLVEEYFNKKKLIPIKNQSNTACCCNVLKIQMLSVF